MKRPILGITMGDAAGVGPEIIVKALKKEDIYKQIGGKWAIKQYKPNLMILQLSFLIRLSSLR